MIILGTTGNDSINASSNNESIDGQGGQDTLNSASFSGVTLDNRNGNHNFFTVDNNHGDTVIASNSGGDTVSIVGTGNGAFDFIDLQQGTGDMVTESGNGNIRVWAHGAVGLINNGGDTITLGDGNDSVTTGGHDGTGHSKVTLGNGNNNIDGFFSTGDTITVGNGNNIIYPGLGGGHTIKVGGGNNLIMAVANTIGDTIDATTGSGQDVINTGGGNNLIGTNGHAIVYFTDATAGHDTLNDGPAKQDVVSFGYVQIPNAVNLLLTDSGDHATIGSHLYDMTGGGVAQYYLTPHGNDTVTITQSLSHFVYAGGTGNDIINANGSTGNDTLYGGSGNDTITSSNGHNILDALAGNNSIVGHGSDLIYLGTGGNNTISGNANDTIDYTYAASGVNLNFASGGTSADTIGSLHDSYTGISHINLGGFNDTVTISGSTAATLHGVDGNDSISAAGSNGSHSIFGDGGNDTIIGGSGSGSLSGGSGDDSINAGIGASKVSGGDGNDFINASGSNLAMNGLHGDAGNDTILGSMGPNTVYGDDGNDSIVGGPNVDCIFGGAGADTINGAGQPGNANVAGGVPGSNNDYAIYSDSTAGVSINMATGQNHGGYAEGDKLTNIENILGSLYNDTIVGDAQNNTLGSFDGNDSIYGGAGDDWIEGGAGADTMDGGSGHDLVSYLQGAPGNIRVDLAAGTGSGADAQGDRLTGIEYVIAGNGNDVLIGDGNSNNLWAGYGNDVIIGGGGGDNLYGGSGSDTMTGGYGTDYFHISSYLYDAANSTSGLDVITNFERGVDKIHVVGVSTSVNMVAGRLMQYQGVSGIMVFVSGIGDVAFVDNVNNLDINNDFAYY